MLAPSLFPSQSSQTTHIDFHKYASQREREKECVCVCACECWSKNGNRLLTLALAKATQSTRRSRKVGAFTSIAQHKQVIYKSTKKGTMNTQVYHSKTESCSVSDMSRAGWWATREAGRVLPLLRTLPPSTALACGWAAGSSTGTLALHARCGSRARSKVGVEGK